MAAVSRVAAAVQLSANFLDCAVPDAEESAGGTAVQLGEDRADVAAHGEDCGGRLRPQFCEFLSSDSIERDRRRVDGERAHPGAVDGCGCARGGIRVSNRLPADAALAG